MSSKRISLPGSSGHYVSTPDADEFDITGDIDLRVRLKMTDWTPSSAETILSKYNTSGNQRSYEFLILSTGAPRIQWSEDGSTFTSLSSSAVTGFTNGTTHWIRATLDVDNGSSQHVATFYTSSDGETWTTLDTKTSAGTTSINAGTADLIVGARNDGSANNLDGEVYQAEMYDGIDGTRVAVLQARKFGNGKSDGATAQDLDGNLWTINGSNSVVLPSAVSYYGKTPWDQATVPDRRRKKKRLTALLKEDHVNRDRNKAI